jgi:hypothetical protein
MQLVHMMSIHVWQMNQFIVEAVKYPTSIDMHRGFELFCCILSMKVVFFLADLVALLLLHKSITKVSGIVRVVLGRMQIVQSNRVRLRQLLRKLLVVVDQRSLAKVHSPLLELCLCHMVRQSGERSSIGWEVCDSRRRGRR